jgi:hypothetical protein
MCLDHITASQDAHIAGPFAMPESAANEQLLLPPHTLALAASPRCKLQARRRAQAVSSYHPYRDRGKTVTSMEPDGRD